MEGVSVHIYVYGLVQGVYFRQSLKKMALKQNVFGWTRNLADGRVEAVLQGRKEDVEKVIAWSKQGPSRARVKKVQEEWDFAAPKYEKFNIIS